MRALPSLHAPPRARGALRSARRPWKTGSPTSSSSARVTTPLFLGGSASSDNPAISVHGIALHPRRPSRATPPSSRSSPTRSAPTSPTFRSARRAAGETFRFEGATPVRTSISAGPIYAERAQTLGRGRLFVSLVADRPPLRDAARRSARRRAARLHPLQRGLPRLRRDLRRGLHALRRARPRERDHRFHARPGRERGRHGVAAHLWGQRPHRFRRGGPLRPDLPARHQHRHHHSVRQRRRAGAHFFAGTRRTRSSPPAASSEGSSSGLGDVSARAQGQPARGRRRSRWPSSPKAGSPPAARRTCAAPAPWRSAGSASSRRGWATFSPHANVGYQYRGRELDPDVFLLTAGFDQLLAPWATLAADLISEFPVGTSEIPVPQRRGARGAVPARRSAPPPSRTAGTTSSTRRSASSSRSRRP